MNFNNQLNATHQQAYPDPRFNMQFYTDPSGPMQVSPVPTPMYYFESPQPSLSLDRKRKAEDEQLERRVRSGAPPPPSFRFGGKADSGVDSTPISGRRWTGDRDGEGRGSWGMRCEEYPGALRWEESSPRQDVTALRRPATVVKPGSDSFWREGARLERALKHSRAFESSLSPEMHGALPRHSGVEVPDTSLPPKMFGTPPGYSRNLAAPRGGYEKRKRTENEHADHDEAQERSKRIQPNVQEMNAGTTKPTQIPIEARTEPPSIVPKIDASISTIPYTGLKLGQLLPCGEILGFASLPPLAQLYDIYSVSILDLPEPPAQHAWIQHTWHSIRTSLGYLPPPAWQLDDNELYAAEIAQSGTVSKAVTLSAIKTFRELGERLQRAGIGELREEMLGLVQKEMDYTVLLLLVHGQVEERGAWEERLRVLLKRLDPAKRARNAPATISAPVLGTQDQYFGAAAPGFPMPVQQEAPETVPFFDPWLPSVRRGPPGPALDAHGTIAVKDKPVDVMQWAW